MKSLQNNKIVFGNSLEQIIGGEIVFKDLADVVSYCDMDKVVFTGYYITFEGICPDPFQVISRDNVYIDMWMLGRAGSVHIDKNGCQSEFPIPVSNLDYISRVALSNKDIDELSMVLTQAGQDKLGLLIPQTVYFIFKAKWLKKSKQLILS